MIKKHLWIFVFIGACQPQLPPYEVPYADFDDIVINLNLPSYNDLSTDKAAMTIDGGVRGIILYRKSETEYLAFERNCSYQPEQACATVDIDNSTLYMTDSCCGSSFSFTSGDPIGGPAIYPLRRYRTFLDGSILTITDEPVEF